MTSDRDLAVRRDADLRRAMDRVWKSICEALQRSGGMDDANRPHERHDRDGREQR
jgi:hypothetical protein